MMPNDAIPSNTLTISVASSVSCKINMTEFKSLCFLRDALIYFVVKNSELT